MALRYRFLLLFSAAAMIFNLYAAAGDSSYFNQKGLDELRSGNPAQAAEFFLLAITADPGQKHYYNNLAAAYIRTGEYAKAEEQLAISLKIDPGYARALSNMSVALFHMGRYRESYRYYILSMKTDSEYTRKRFDKNRITDSIKKLSDEKPDDGELKKIKEYVEAEKGVDQKKN